MTRRSRACLAASANLPSAPATERPARRRSGLSLRQGVALAAAAAAGLAGAVVSPVLGVLAAAFVGAAGGGLLTGVVAVIVAATGAPVLHALTHSLLAPEEWITGLVALGHGLGARAYFSSNRHSAKRTSPEN